MENRLESVFGTLNRINVGEHIERKNGLSYLSWAWAWAEVKKNFPTAFYTIYESKDGWNYFTDGRTCWVKTGVTIEGLEHIEFLPVMDMRNKSIELARVTSFDVNKAIQRSLTKACARHGLGLYVYAGEDLPEEDKPETPQKKDPYFEKAYKTVNDLKPKDEDDGKLPWEDVIEPQVVNDIYATAQRAGITDEQLILGIKLRYSKSKPEELNIQEANDTLRRLEDKIKDRGTR